jgi:hypothetical protein
VVFEQGRVGEEAEEALLATKRRHGRVIGIWADSSRQEGVE